MAAVCALFGCTGEAVGRVGAAHLAVDAGRVDDDAGPPPVVCTLTQGYWKNHAEDWPVSSLVLGGEVYTQAQLLTLLRTAPRGDASLILAHQLIATLLNGVDASIADEVADAHAWLADNADGDGRLPFGTASGSDAHEDATDIADALADYNEGVTGPGHCGRAPVQVVAPQ
ncbi:hypothetical protein DB32_004947 [Sandaracinus amylolyticus]|uniref:Uncharacterized protein n=2 Tax=Sandaracinus amylolyticus TaxID=927083 RepID=A0A0F6W5B2_9BACT|nr:hypothetical protein DB32_004947 [Sandaracinus amylolyticus]